MLPNSLPPERLACYPNLTSDNYAVTSNEDEDYNCAAWAADDTETKWWPQPDFPEYFWPTPRRDDSLGAFVEGYSALGYEVCDSLDPENGYDKVVVYATDDEPQHVARQRADGTWTSKLGIWEDISHSDTKGLECDMYGKVALIMRRQRAEQEAVSTD